MISELRKALEGLEKLSENEQRRIADLILDEMKWDKTLAQSQEGLSQMANEALEDYKTGRTKPMDI